MDVRVLHTPIDAPARSHRRPSLKAQFVVLLCLAMGPAAVIGFSESLAAIHRQSQRSSESLLQTAMISVLADRQVIAAAHVLLDALAAQDAVKKHEHPACETLLQTAIAPLADYETLVVTDPTGHAVCATTAIGAEEAFGDSEWFREIAGGRKFALSALVASRLSGSPTVVAAVPLRGDNGTFIGGLSLAIRITALTGQASDPTAEPHPLTVLLDETGRMIPLARNAGVAAQLPPPDVIRAHLKDEGAVFQTDGVDGDTRLYALVPVIDDKLLAVAIQTPTGASRSRSVTMWVVAGIPLLIWLVAIITMWLGLERLVLRWVEYLRRVSAVYARGHYSVMPRQIDRAPREFQDLGRTLSQMAVTARERQRDLRAVVEQKNTLVREIHHRVKNNLQIIQSLLNLQSRSAGDSNQFTALAAAKSRINALALVHQSLYEDENLEYVNLRAFLNDLCRHLLQSGWGAAKRVGITVDVPDLVTTADFAVPISLLVTEAVTNALKHAFFGRDAGTITVRMVNDPERGAELTIRDNGIGIATMPRTPGRQQSGIGYSLIEGFARQLRGAVKTAADNGTTVTVVFPYLDGRKAPAQRASA